MHCDVWVQIEFVEQSVPPMVHGCVAIFPVEMQIPLQSAEVGHGVTVGVQDWPVGHGPPVVQPTGGVGVAIHAPPQGPEVGDVIVGVHVEPVGQGALLPTVHGMLGGGVKMLRQRPPQTEVGVQVEPVAQGG